MSLSYPNTDWSEVWVDSSPLSLLEISLSILLLGQHQLGCLPDLTCLYWFNPVMFQQMFYEMSFDLHLQAAQLATILIEH